MAALKILIAEDNIDVSDTVAILLKMQGYTVEVAHDGESAVELAVSFRPDVALLDIGMPKLRGYEVARQIREHMGSRVVLIALTAWGRASDKYAAKEAGFEHHFVKPANVEELGRLLAELAARKASRPT